MDPSGSIVRINQHPQNYKCAKMVLLTENTQFDQIFTRYCWTSQLIPPSCISRFESYLKRLRTVTFVPIVKHLFTRYAEFWGAVTLTILVPVSYQQPTSPYITHTKYDIW